MIIFPGSNCDRDAFRALHAAGFRDVSYASWRDPLPKSDLFVIPGGFSWGDYLRPGAISARCTALRSLHDHVRRGAFVLGICNGFQILTEAGFLPGALIRNRSLRFVCRPVALRVENTSSPFTETYQSGDTLRFTVAHQDGSFFAAPDVLARIEDAGHIALRYDRGDNPNGSCHDIAAIVNATGNVMGLMPHPERHIESFHSGRDGLRFFRGILDATI